MTKARIGNEFKRVKRPDPLSKKQKMVVKPARPVTDLDLRKHPNTRVRGSRVNTTGRGKRPRGERQPLKNTDYCPRCKVYMDRIDTIVEHDERYCGDGDYEMGTSAFAIYKCPECGRESEIDLGFSGSGILR